MAAARRRSSRPCPGGEIGIRSAACRAGALLGRSIECAALLSLFAGSARAGERGSGQGEGLSRTDGFSAGPGWKINLGIAYADTFAFSAQDVLPLAEEGLVRDKWRIRPAEPPHGRIVTEWQPVRHLFVRLFCGEVRERSVVDVSRIDDNRCLVKFRAALATRKSLAGNPLLPRIRKEYETGVRDWQRKLRVSLAERSRTR